MRMSVRRLALWLVAIGLLALAVAPALARDYGPPDPADLAPGIREPKPVIMVIPGTYGRLWPIRPFPISKDDNKDGGVEMQSATGSGLPQFGMDQTPPQRQAPVPPANSKFIFTRLKMPETFDSSAGQILVGMGGDASPTTHLEQGLRDLIGQLAR